VTGSTASGLRLNIGYKDRFTSTSYGADYTNDGTATSTSAPGAPKSVNALQIGSTYPVQPIGTNAQGLYRYTLDIPIGAAGSNTEALANAGTGIAMLEGHPVKTIPATGGFKRTIPVQSAYAQFKIRDSSYTTTFRRPVVDVAKCNQCHDALSMHGDNRTASTTYGIGACTTCHNSANTDIVRRAALTTPAADGLKEQAIDMKFMVHRIHKGRDLTYNFVVYGYGGSDNLFAGEFPPGRILNDCQNCHFKATDTLPSYFTVTGGAPSGVTAFAEDTNAILVPFGLPEGIKGTTIDSGTSRVDHADDLNISPNSATCYGCHDSDAAKTHMTLMGGNFSVLESGIEF
jgi:OmcA/MtrC family decaheme c-type cytochrome